MSDAQHLPVWQRKWMINRTIKELEEIKKKQDQAIEASKGKK